MAVDQSTGDLLVIDAGAGTVSRWNPDGTAANFSALGINVIDGKGTSDEVKVPEGGGLAFGDPAEVQVAVDNSGGATDGDIYVPQAGAKVVDIFASTGEFIGQLSESSEGVFAEPCGVAVDPSGNLYVGDFSGHIHKYEPAANPPVNGDSSANFAFAKDCTLAAGAAATEGSLFPVKFGAEEGKVSKLDATNGEEKYVVDPGPTSTISVDPGTGRLVTAVRTSEVSEGEVREYDASGESKAELLSSFKVPSRVTGIAVSKAGGDIYVARAGNAKIEVWGPAVSLPKATTEAAAVVNRSVRMRGVVNSEGGPPATCVFQYVEVKGFEAEEGFEGATSVPCSPAGPFTGSSGVAVSAEVKELPEAAYRFRLLASNANGSREGGRLFFNTFARIALPDERAYEMVSPPQKLGEVIPPEPSLGLGGRFNSHCPASGNCLPGINKPTTSMQVAPDGESIVYEGQPFFAGLSGAPNEYLSRRSGSGWSTESLSPLQYTDQTGYKAFSSDLARGVLAQTEPALSPEAPGRGGESFANLYLESEGGAPQPLVGEEPPHREPGEGFEVNSFIVHYGGANAGTNAAAASVPAFSHIVFEANDALTKEVPGFAPEAKDGGGGGGVNATNLNVYEWVGGQLRLVNVYPDKTTAPGAVIGSGRLSVKNALREAPGLDHAISADGSRIFWSKESSGQVYVRIDGKETREIQDPGGFLTASEDGSKVLLDDGCLYDLEAAVEPCEELSGGAGGFQGILGASEDLSRVYFVDKAVLSGEEKNANKEKAEAGAFNLYGWQEGEAGGAGKTTFIGRLLEGDNDRYGDWRAAALNRTAQVSADGRYLAFMSRARLTGYDNEVRSIGCRGLAKDPICFEVFEYDTAAATLTCASCNPSGQGPLGQSSLSLVKQAGPLGRQPGNLAANGRLFFESQDELSASDANGAVQDVYEWEPDETGTCELAGGCVNLISSGHGGEDAFFLDATPSGDDAFFVTRERLLPQDKDDRLDLYDARVGGGIEEAPMIPCSGDGCKGPVSSPLPPLGGPGSAEFSGPGNPAVSCKAGFVRKQGKCVKKKHPKHKKHHKRSAKHNRGGSR